MTRQRQRWRVAGLGLIVGVLALPWLLRWLLWQWEQNPILRGRELAAAQGCFSCHRPDGSREIPNPGSRWGSVPRFRTGNAMMYASNRAEIEEFIRFGATRVWLDEPKALARLDRQPVRMPAYGDRLEEHEIADLVAYASAVEEVELVGGEMTVAGRALAKTEGCTSCHGVEGAGGHTNPGSMGGFIPGFRGRNFGDLVKDRGEFEQWVRTGTSQRLARNPIARFFWRRQAISMPAYQDTLDAEQIDQLWAWVVSLRDPTPAP